MLVLATARRARPVRPAPRAAATPQIHAHRGGTVVNGKPTLRGGEPRRLQERRAQRVRARGGREAHRGRRAGRAPRRHARPHHELHGRGAHLHARRAGRLQYRRARRPRQPAAHEPASRHSSRSARCSTTPSRAGATVNLEIKNVPSDPDFDSTPAYANSVMDAVLASRIPRAQLMIQSFIPANLDVARQRMPGVATSLLSLQALNELFLQVAADKDYDIISPEWPVSADYVSRAHGIGLDVAPFTLDAAADVRAAQRRQGRRADHRRSTDGGPGARPAPAALLHRHRVHRRAAADRGRRPARAARRVRETGMPRQDHDAGDDREAAHAQVRGRLNRNCEFRFGTRRTPPRLGPPTATVRFDGNATCSPRSTGRTCSCSSRRCSIPEPAAA